RNVTPINRRSPDGLERTAPLPGPAGPSDATGSVPFTVVNKHRGDIATMAAYSWLRTWVNRGTDRRGRRANRSRLPLRLESLEFRELPSAGALMLFDFGTATSPVAKDYDRVAPATTYQAPPGYGWLSGQVAGIDRGSGITPPPRLTRDFDS